MLQIGLWETNMHFSKYLKLVREGQEIIVTKRENPFAVIKPRMKEETPEDKSKSLEDRVSSFLPKKAVLPDIPAPYCIAG